MEPAATGLGEIGVTDPHVETGVPRLRESSCQWLVARLSMRRATLVQWASTVVLPASRPTRRASARASAARTIIFDGMHP